MGKRAKTAENGSRGLTARHLNGIAALLSAPTVKEASKIAGVGETTMHRWLSEPPFREALQKAAGDALRQAMSRLQAQAGRAIDVLIELCDSTEAGASARVAAARAVLDYSFRSLQVSELEALIDELKQAQAIRELEEGA